MKTAPAKKSFVARFSRLVENLRCEKSCDSDVTLPGPSEKIENIDTRIFGFVVSELRNNGWKKIKEYDGFDAWIDRGMLVLSKRGELLKCCWTNWLEGSFEGPPHVIEQIKAMLKDQSQKAD
jgi:hypothetical protein